MPVIVSPIKAVPTSNLSLPRVRGVGLRRNRVLIVIVYLAANFFAMFVAAYYGKILGDFPNIPPPGDDIVYVIFLAIAASFLIVLGPFYEWLTRISRSNCFHIYLGAPSVMVSVSIALLQIFYLFYSLFTGSGIAGTVTKTDSIFKYVFYIINVDFMTLIYLSLYRHNRMMSFNLVVFLFSSIVRGWSFGFLFVGWILLTRLTLSGVKISRWLFSSALAILLIYPVIVLFKFYIRTGGDISLSLGGFETIFDKSGIDLGDVYLLSYTSLVERLQLFGSIAAMLERLSEIRSLVDSGFIRPYFLEGVYGLGVARLMGGGDAYELNTVLVSLVLGTDLETSAYATHIGILGWPIVFGDSVFNIGLYLLFNLLLIALGGTLVRNFSTHGLNELNWMMCCVLIVHGWFGAYIAYLISGGIFYLLARRCRLY